MRFLRYLLFIVVATFAIMTNVFSAEPTAKETLNYIKKTIKGCPDRTWEELLRLGRNHFKEMPDFISNNTSVYEYYFQIVSRTYANDGTFLLQLVDTQTTRVSFSELSPEVDVNTDKHGHPIVILRCSNAGCFDVTAVAKRPDVADTETSSTANSDSIYICSIDSAERIAKAFSHIIKLNGGKESLF